MDTQSDIDNISPRFDPKNTSGLRVMRDMRTMSKFWTAMFLQATMMQFQLRGTPREFGRFMGCRYVGETLLEFSKKCLEIRPNVSADNADELDKCLTSCVKEDQLPRMFILLR